MKIVFALRSWMHVHYYHSLIVALYVRGHSIHLLFDKEWSSHDTDDALKTLTSEVPAVTWVYMQTQASYRKYFIGVLRELRSYRRYLVVEGQSDYYRRRWRNYLPLFLNIFVRLPGVGSFLGSRFAGKMFAWIEQKTPPDSEVLAQLTRLSPDVLVAAPLNLRFSTELEFVKAAKVIGVPSVLPVFSWDNLTTKGLIHVHPDRVLVWSEAQKNEAIVHHDIAENSISVVGSIFFDKWFVNRTASSREEFFKTLGFNSAAPLVTYLGSSRNIAPNEKWLVKELRNAFDKAGLEKVQLVVRPHPANSKPYAAFSLPHTTVTTVKGGIPSTPESVQLLYDTLVHSSFVVGINTSAMIDAICLNVPVVSVLTREYQETQEEAAHFKALQNSNAVEIVNSPEACAEVAKKILRGEDTTRNGREHFLSEWIRPLGEGKLAGEWAADIIEKLL